MYPDDDIARRLNVSTRTVLRHRSRNQLPRVLPSHPATRHASALTITNVNSRQVKEALQSGASGRHTTGRSGETMRPQAAV